MSVEPEPRITGTDASRSILAHPSPDGSQPGSATEYDRAKFVVENGVTRVILPTAILPMVGGDGWERPRVVGEGQSAFLLRLSDEGGNGRSQNGDQTGEFVVLHSDEVKFTMHWKYPIEAKREEIRRLRKDGYTIINTRIRDFGYSTRFLAVRERREWE
ncbi:MAG: hypothetical protein HYW63_03830 [Candidatus Levybacteria bacterium]|nr:hypothetical protein [Candidatus Levybacteria bacterium]